VSRSGLCVSRENASAKVSAASIDILSRILSLVGSFDSVVIVEVKASLADWRRSMPKFGQNQPVKTELSKRFQLIIERERPREFQ
jgi:hypothetical protein